jgi:hypothetical protein
VSLLVLAPGGLEAQGWRELQAGVVVLGSEPAVVGAGAGLAWRDRGRTRVGVFVAAGAADRGGWTGRGEVAWHFLLDPGRRTGAGVYGGGGLAVTAVEGDEVRPFVQVVLGVESEPASPQGGFVELGIGGGVRVAAGVRWRKRNAPGR